MLTSNVQISARLHAHLAATVRAHGEYTAAKIQLTADDLELDLISTKGIAARAGTALDILRPPFFDTQAAAYYVIKLASTNSITLVSYVPDNKGVSARTRMLYAASLPVLRAALAMGGDDGLSAEFQLVSVDDLSTARKDLAERTTSIDHRKACMSAAELERADVVEAEEQTRKEQMKTFEARLGALNLRQSFSSRLRRGQQRGGNHNADGQSTDGISDESIVNHADGKETAAARSGGFLPVHLPLTEAAKASLQAFFDGVKRPALAPTAAGNGDGDVRQLNKLLEMAIVVDGTHVEVLVTKSVMIHDEESKHKLFPVNHDECRFYLYAFDSGKIAFIFSCPANTQPRERMRYSAARAGLVDDVVRIWSGKPLLLANQRKTFPFVHIASSSKPNVPNAATTQANDERFDLNLQLFDVSDFHHAYIEQELPARRVLGNGDFAQAAVAPERPVVMKRLSRPKSAFARTFMAGGIGTDGLPMPSTAVTAETTTVETTTVVDNKSMTRQSLTGRPLSMISRLDEHRLEASHADADINTETCTVLIPPSLGGASLLMHASPPPDVPLPPTPSNVSELDAAGSA